MFRRNMIGASIATTLLVAAGFATAEATGISDLVDAGGEAAAGATGSYAVDGSGAYAVVAATSGDAQDAVRGTYDDAKGLLDQSQFETQFACPSADVAPPEVPLDGLNHVEAAHADRLEKALDARTGLVDANMDVSLWGNVRGFFTGIADALTGLFDTKVPAPDACGTAADLAGETDVAHTMVAEARTVADGVMENRVELPALEPSVSGEYGLEHAGELSGGLMGVIDTP